MITLPPNFQMEEFCVWLIREKILYDKLPESSQQYFVNKFAKKDDPEPDPLEGLDLSPPLRYKDR